MSSAPQWAFGPNAPPVYPGHMPEPKPTEEQASTEPEPIQTGQPEDPSAPPNEIDKREEQLDLEENQTAPDISSAAEENETVQAEQAQDEPTEDQPAQDEPTEEESRPEPIYLEDLDPHTQRVVYSAMANAPQLGLGPKAVFGTRFLEPEPPEPDETPSEKPAKRRRSEPINLNRHESQCTICNHPERAAIDEAFLHWWRATDLAYHFRLGHRLNVYRHAKATGLYQQRLERTQHALGYMIEQAETVTPTADSIIRAIRALSCLDENGRWHEPRKEILIMHQYLNSPALPTGK